MYFLTKIRWVLTAPLLIAAFFVHSQEYGSTDFEATGLPEAHEAFTLGLLKMHNFEYADALESFKEAQAIDPNFTMAYWGEALAYDQFFWHRHDLEKSRAAMAKLGSTAEERASRAVTQREKDYLHTIEVLFGEGSEHEREVAYSDALQALHEKYPEDLDAAAFYALSILATSYDGRDYARYMKAGAITESILAVNPRHPGALHYNIHSYDDPIHAPLGLRSAKTYNEVAPSAVHALHMGSHIYYALGMWELGVERNIRSYEEDVSRQADPNDPYGGQAYHALTWVPYGYQQMGDFETAREYIGRIEKQVEQYGDQASVHRNHYVTTRASFLVDSLDWDGDLADVQISHDGLSDYAITTDLYVDGLVALNRGDVDKSRSALRMMNMHAGEEMGGMSSMEGMVMTSARRADTAPLLLRLALEGQIELASGNAEKAVELISRAEQIEGALASEYGPAVPVQPMAELLADVYRETGDNEMARKYYELSLTRAVGRHRSLEGLAKLSD
ncbi:MAG: hypothetical protein HOL48_09255 [Porticoccaceae bacterium]|nr:hypothetical protein [Porticoccaceae bacterium]